MAAGSAEIDAIAYIKSHLITSGNLYTQLGAIETARSVTIPRLGELGMVEALGHQFPALSILLSTSEPAYSDGDTTRVVEGFDIHTLIAVFEHCDNDREAAQNVLAYYDLALSMVIKADNTFGDLFPGGVRRSSMDFTMRMAEQGKLVQTLNRRLQVRMPFEERGS